MIRAALFAACHLARATLRALPDARDVYARRGIAAGLRTLYRYTTADLRAQSFARRVAERAPIACAVTVKVRGEGL